MKKQIFLLLVLTVLFSSLASAASNFYIESKVVNNEVFLEESALFEITINNFYAIDDIYSLSTVSSDWIVSTGGIPVTVEADQKKTYEVQLKPGSDLQIGVYNVEIKFKSARTGEIERKIFNVQIKSFDPIFGTYRPSVVLGVDIADQVDPRINVPVEIFLRNRNRLDIGVDIASAKVIVDGNLFYKEYMVPLGPLDEKRDELLFTLDEFQEPGIYPLSVKLEILNVTISEVNKNYEIIGFSTVSIDRTPSSVFFKKTETIVLENIGNTEKTKEIQFKLPFYKKFFTSTEPKAEYVKSEEEKYLLWEVTLQPQETAELVIVQNYRLPLVILFFFVILIVMYYLTRSPLIVLKEAFIEGSTKDGVSELKVRLFIKNRSRKNIRGAKLIDRLSSMLDLKKEKHLGTLHPSKITVSDKKGTVLKWDLENLEPFEERIVTYEVISKLKIIGSIKLPKAKINFPNKGRERTTFSNDTLV
jgi:hypothetical protein